MIDAFEQPSILNSQSDASVSLCVSLRLNEQSPPAKFLLDTRHLGSILQREDPRTTLDVPRAVSVVLWHGLVLRGEVFFLKCRFHVRSAVHEPRGRAQRDHPRGTKSRESSFLKVDPLSRLRFGDAIAGKVSGKKNASINHRARGRENGEGGVEVDKRTSLKEEMKKNVDREVRSYASLFSRDEIIRPSRRVRSDDANL